MEYVLIVLILILVLYIALVIYLSTWIAKRLGIPVVIVLISAFTPFWPILLLFAIFNRPPVVIVERRRSPKKGSKTPSLRSKSKTPRMKRKST